MFNIAAKKEILFGTFNVAESGGNFQCPYNSSLRGNVLSTFHADESAIVIPKDAVYRIHASVLAKAVNKDAALWVHVNGSQRSAAWIAGNTQQQVIIETKLNLSAGDVVELVWYGESVNLWGHVHSYFEISEYRS